MFSYGYNSDGSYASTSSLSSDDSEIFKCKTTREDLVKEYKKTNMKFHKACRQVILLNNKIDSLIMRYSRAVWGDSRAFRYFHRLNMATIEGVRDMFCDYALQQAEKLDLLYEQIISQRILAEELD